MLHYLVIDTEHTPGEVSIVEDAGEMSGSPRDAVILGTVNAARLIHLADEDRIFTAAKQLAADAGWYVEGEWEVTADEYLARVARMDEEN